MFESSSNRRLVLGSLFVIAAFLLLQLSPTSPLRIRRPAAAPRPAPVQPSQPAAGPIIEMLAPEEVPAEATTTIGFRILDTAGKVLRQFALPPADTLDITISDAQTALSWSLPATFDEESGMFMALLKLDKPGDYRITAQCNFSGRPPLRQAGSVRVVSVE
jgi:hypothetical protein